MNANDLGKMKSALLLSAEVTGDEYVFWFVDGSRVVFAGAVVETGSGETGMSIVGEGEASMVDLKMLVDMSLLMVKDCGVGTLTPNPVRSELEVCLAGQEDQIMTYFVLIKVKDSIHILEKYVSNQPAIWSKGVFSDDLTCAQSPSWNWLPKVIFWTDDICDFRYYNLHWYAR